MRIQDPLSHQVRGQTELHEIKSQKREESSRAVTEGSHLAGTEQSLCSSDQLSSSLQLRKEQEVDFQSEPTSYVLVSSHGWRESSFVNFSVWSLRKPQS